MAWQVSFFWITLTLAPLLYFPSLMKIPCNSPPFLVSWLPECSASQSSPDDDGGGPTFLWTLPVATVDIMVFWYANMDILFHSCYNKFNYMSCVLQYMWVLGDIQTRPKTGKHSTCRDGDHDDNKPDDINFYMGIILLSKLVETRCSTRIFLPMWISIGCLQILAMYGTLKAGDIVEGNRFLIYLVATVALDMVIGNLVIYTLGGNVSSESKQLLEKYGENTNPRDKLRKKRLRALRVVGIRFGGKYMDNDTPIVVQDFCLNQTVSILLMHES
jgi:hypothetical protein